MSDLIRAAEAGVLVGKDKRQIYHWAKNGFLEGQYVLGDRRYRGIMMFERSEVLRVAEFMTQGYRKPKPKRVPAYRRSDPVRKGDADVCARTLRKRRKDDRYVFEDWQIEVARKVFG